MKIILPIINDNQIDLENDYNDDEIYNRKIIDQDVFNKVIKNNFKISFDNCYIKNISFSDFENLYFDAIDCIFLNCDLSNLDLSSKSFHRCIIDNCKLVGTDLSNSSIIDVKIINSTLRYSNYNKANIKNVILDDNDFYESSFSNIKFGPISLSKNNFTRCEFIDTKLDKIDFSSSNIDGIVVSISDLKGMIVNYEQAVELTSLLGIKIKKD
ncbi:MAG: pentapeptide repeat-containing protein [Bacilli bacterium]|nr:pentapeptide repeat-containing protein [Bacilli bacterium]